MGGAFLFETAMSNSQITRHTFGPRTAFELRCRARARFFADGELELHDAVDVLQHDAEVSGLVAELGQDAVQAIIAAAFSTVRGDQP
jgi:hypothetical protein